MLVSGSRGGCCAAGPLRPAAVRNHDPAAVRAGVRALSRRGLALAAVPDRVPWHGAVGFANRLNGAGVVDLLILLEQVGGFTLLGYAMAEWRGRRELSLGSDLPFVVASVALFAGSLELAQGGCQALARPCCARSLPPPAPLTALRCTTSPAPMSAPCAHRTRRPPPPRPRSTPTYERGLPPSPRLRRTTGALAEVVRPPCHSTCMA